MLGLLRTTAVLIGAGGAMAGAVYGMFQQGRRARRTLAVPGWLPFRADGVYFPDGAGPFKTAPFPPETPEIPGTPGAPGTPGGLAGEVLRLAVLGDSSAAGLGVDQPDELPGVVLARGLAEEAGRPVRLATLAVCGCTSRGLGSQVDTALTSPPHAVLIMIGANDVTRRIPLYESTALIGAAVSRLRAAGTAVVVGTCPDLGVIRSIPQPLRAIARAWSLALARLQRGAVLHAGGLPVPIAELLAPEFFTQPRLFSRDQFHPSTAGYDAACSVLLPALCSALGVWGGGPVPLVSVSAAARVDRPDPGGAPADPTAAPGTLSSRRTTVFAAFTAGGWSTRAIAALDRGVRRAQDQALGTLPAALGHLGPPQLRPDHKPATS